jgi:hypothetical protein
MRENITKPRQISIPSNVELEAKSVVVVVWRDGEARREKQELRGRQVGQAVLGVVQTKENEEEMLDIQKWEESSGSKSETPIEMKADATERIERGPNTFTWPAKWERTGSGCDKWAFENG